MTGQEITDPISCIVKGDTAGWWVLAESSKGKKKWGPYPMQEALRLQERLVRKWRAEGRMR